MDNKKNGIPKLRFPGFTGAWEQRKLGEVAKKITKGTTPHDKSWSGPVNYVKTESIDSNNGNISVIANTSLEEHEGYLKRSQLKENDVLFSIVGTLGRVGVVKKKDLPANTNQQICIIRPFEENSFFLLNALKTNRVKSFIKSDATIGAQPSLSLWQIEGLRIPFPNLEEQQKISAFFVKLDSLIALHQRKLEHLQEQKKGLLQKMFPKNGETVPEVRFPGFTDAWEQRKLGEVADVRDGTHDSPRYINEGYPLLTSKNVGNGYINYDDVKYVSENDYVQINKRSKVDINDILMGMIGTIGNLALIREEPDFAIKNVALIKHTSNFDYRFLFQELQTSAISKELLSGMDGGTQKFVSLKKIRNLSVMLPSENEQKQIGAFFKQFDSLIALHQRKLDHLELMKKGLLQQMFV